MSLSVSAPTSTSLTLSQIGFGNWGSVWLCRPKDDEGQPVPDDAAVEARGMGKVAVKLVHRSKTSTTAARVRSLYVSYTRYVPHPDCLIPDGTR